MVSLHPRAKQPGKGIKVRRRRLATGFFPPRVARRVYPYQPVIRRPRGTKKRKL
jgi:hypothetical protein